jgi:ribosomal protein S18 acetylase RimI-like enzyme
MLGTRLQLPPFCGLRQTVDEDLDVLERIYASTRTIELAQTDWSDQFKTKFIHMQFLAQASHYRQHYPGAEYWLILYEQVTAGRLYLHYRGSEVRIMDIAILPDYRNLGIGTHVLKGLQNIAKISCQRLSIHVERFNPAQRLYQRLGFECQDQGDVYCLMEWSASTGDL